MGNQALFRHVPYFITLSVYSLSNSHQPRMMWLSAYCAVLLILPTRSSCGLREEVEKLREKWSSEDQKCFETVMNATSWESHKFLVISEEMSTIESGFLKGSETYDWRLKSARSHVEIKVFMNVIILTKDFDSLNEILNTVDTKRINNRVKYVISVKKNYSSLDEIREASEGIPEAIWSLDKTRVILLVRCSKEIFAMTYFPFSNNCQPGKLEVLNVWREGNFTEKIDLFPEKMFDIHGCVKNYSVIFYPSLELQGFKEHTEGGVAVLGGVGGKLVYIIAEKMNMKLYLLPEEPASRYMLVQQLTHDESLFSVFGGVPIAEYHEILDQNIVYMQESFGFGYLSGGFEVSWTNFFWPMKAEVWDWTGYTILFFCPVVLAANLVHRRRADRSDRLRFLDVFGILFGNARLLPSTIFGRYLFGIWIFYSYLITSAYNSGLVSFLTTPNEMGVINSFKELLSAEIDFGGGKIHRKFYNDPTDPVMMEIYNKFKIWSDNESIRMVRGGKGATGIVTSMCSVYNKKLRGKEENQLRMMQDKAFTFHVPIKMRRGSPFTIGVHHYALQAIQNGLVDYWLRYYTDVPHSKKIRSKTPTVITVRQVRGIFYLYLIGVKLSCLVFVGELIFHKNFLKLRVRRGSIGI